MTTAMLERETDGEEPGEAARAGEDAWLSLLSQTRLFRSGDGQFHARLPIGDRDEVFALKSAEFREWLIESYRAECGDVLSGRALRRTISSFHSRARTAEATPEMHVRIGREEVVGLEHWYVDLGDSTRMAIRISPQEWAVVDRSPVQFCRTRGQLALPYPTREGSIDRLRPYVNVNDQDFRLLVGWMASALMPEGPYPILAIHGEQGSAKSTLSKVVRSLIDPQAPAVLAEPRSTRDLMVTALNSWLLVYDNISTIPAWLADGYCRLATGGGFAGRAIYSDGARHVISAQRPLILNGIDDFVHRDDLSDRCVFLNLAPIEASNRRAEGEFWRKFEAERAAIFGGLLTALVGGLRELPSIQMAELPRMADFACLGEAVGRALGWPEGTFLATYSANRLENTVVVLEESMVATALLDCASLGGLQNWTLSATEMVDSLARNLSAEDDDLEALAEVTAGVRERTAANCARAADAGNLGEVHQDAAQPGDHDRRRSGVRPFEWSALFKKLSVVSCLDGVSSQWSVVVLSIVKVVPDASLDAARWVWRSGACGAVEREALRPGELSERGAVAHAAQADLQGVAQWRTIGEAQPNARRCAPGRPSGRGAVAHVAQPNAGRCARQTFRAWRSRTLGVAHKQTFRARRKWRSRTPGCARGKPSECGAVAHVAQPNAGRCAPGKPSACGARGVAEHWALRDGKL